MKNVFGLIVVIFGVGLLLQQANVSWADTVLGSWWPLLIILVGVIAWTSNRRTWFGPFMIVLIGFLLLLDQLKVMQGSSWNYFWPIIVIVIGTRVLLGKSWQGKPGMETSSSANANVIFSGVERKVTGTFTDATANAWFGGIKMDLRDAQFADNAHLEIFAAFGGIELLVPKHVSIATKVTPLFGGAEDKTTPENPTKTLTITGTALFGGVSIKN